MKNKTTTSVRLDMLIHKRFKKWCIDNDTSFTKEIVPIMEKQMKKLMEKK